MMEKEESNKSKVETTDQTEEKEEIQEISAEDKIKDLEDKLARTLAEMENQRRRYEKEKEEAFEYGGFNFAREALNLIDNLERAGRSQPSGRHRNSWDYGVISSDGKSHR